MAHLGNDARKHSLDFGLQRPIVSTRAIRIVETISSPAKAGAQLHRARGTIPAPSILCRSSSPAFAGKLRALRFWQRAAIGHHHPHRPRRSHRPAGKPHHPRVRLPPVERRRRQAQGNGDARLDQGASTSSVVV
ncbi:hypothetical protein LQ953_02115 [Sphingomonas sp. IC-56]|uniref:hypothetical protein n=1 Tax=Sphingomonas sp. IC-56 TaxID=2898529 RepID=UPI001E47E9E7|nr:hypothetical protein [Sphingomonas sp. IC-56]MCD2322807.1 hypothetical protein [Sphingomonas sp. IC-56]